MRSWYLLYTKAREELRAKQHLENQGYKVFLPMVSIEKLRRGKRTSVSEALFPCYLFIELDLEKENSAPIRSTRGVSGFVRFGMQLPPPIPNILIYELQKRTWSRDEALVDAELPNSGDPVQIHSGQFQHVDAIFHCPDGEQRSILLMDMLGKQVRVKVDNTAFRKK